MKAYVVEEYGKGLPMRLVELPVREAELFTVLAGTSQIQRLVISQALAKGTR